VNLTLVEEFPAKIDAFYKNLEIDFASIFKMAPESQREELIKRLNAEHDQKIRDLVQLEEEKKEQEALEAA